MSRESRRPTTSQSRATRSARSALTMSRPAPHATVSIAPSYWTAILSLPSPAIRDGAAGAGITVGALRAGRSLGASSPGSSPLRRHRRGPARARRPGTYSSRQPSSGTLAPRDALETSEPSDLRRRRDLADRPGRAAGGGAGSRGRRRRGPARARRDDRGDPRGDVAPGRLVSRRAPHGDACIVGADADWEHLHALDVEIVVRVEQEDELEEALERHDPEIFVLAGGDDGERLERVLGLLSDVPAGKLAIAELPDVTREEIEELERAGCDAILLGGSARRASRGRCGSVSRRCSRSPPRSGSRASATGSRFRSSTPTRNRSCRARGSSCTAAVSIRAGTTIRACCSCCWRHSRLLRTRRPTERDRGVAAGLGLIGVAAAWWLGRVSYGPLAGLVAGAAVAVATVHVAYSHVAVTDVLLTALVTVSLALAVQGRLEWAGPAAGLAASAKYPGVFLGGTAPRGRLGAMAPARDRRRAGRARLRADEPVRRLARRRRVGGHLARPAARRARAGSGSRTTIRRRSPSSTGSGRASARPSSSRLAGLALAGTSACVA